MGSSVLMLAATQGFGSRGKRGRAWAVPAEKAVSPSPVLDVRIPEADTIFKVRFSVHTPIFEAASLMRSWFASRVLLTMSSSGNVQNMWRRASVIFQAWPTETLVDLRLSCAFR